MSEMWFQVVNIPTVISTFAGCGGSRICPHFLQVRACSLAQKRASAGGSASKRNAGGAGERERAAGRHRRCLRGTGKPGERDAAGGNRGAGKHQRRKRRTTTRRPKPEARPAE